MKRILLVSGTLVVLSGAPVLAAADESIPPRPVGQVGADLLAEATTGAAPADATQTADAGTGDSPVVNADGSVNASKLIGVDVKSPSDEKIGDIGEVVLDKGGAIQGVVVDVGGFLGIASRPVLLDWNDMQLTEQNGGAATAVVSVSEDRLEQMPAYESSKN